MIHITFHITQSSILTELRKSEDCETQEQNTKVMQNFKVRLGYVLLPRTTESIISWNRYHISSNCCLKWQMSDVYDLYCRGRKINSTHNTFWAKNPPARSNYALHHVEKNNAVYHKFLWEMSIKNYSWPLPQISQDPKRGNWNLPNNWRDPEEKWIQIRKVNTMW